jgi:hypothetical protein
MRHVALSILLMSVAASAAAINPTTEIVLPAATRGQGEPGSFWQMDLFLINPGDQKASVQIFWLERNTDNTGANPVTVTVNAGQELVLNDVINNTLGRSTGAGALRIVSNVPIAANSRVYNLVSNVSFGQGFEGQPPSAAVGVTAGAPAGKAMIPMGTSVPGLKQNAANRSNLFAVAGSAGAGFTVTARRPNGSSLGQKSYSVPPWGAFFKSISKIVGGSPGNLFVDIDVTSGSAWFVGSRIEENTGDPITLAPLGGTELSYDPTDFEGTYTGQWINTTFSTTGAATATVEVDEENQTFEFTSDLDGSVFGASDPPPETFVGPFSPSGIYLTGTSTTFGDTVFEATGQGLMTGTGTNVPEPGIDSVSFIGAFTPETIVLQYTVFFSGGGGTAQGVLSLSKS